MNRRLLRQYGQALHRWIGDVIFLIVRLRWYVGPVVVIILMTGLLWRSGVFERKAVTAIPPAPAVVAPPAFRRTIDGRGVSSVSEQDPNYVAVMIDNMVDAWPQAGIDKASLVIEAPVEAGITRLLAFFPSTTSVEKIGPVRSARPYYVDWAQEYDALYAHVGGSPEALERVSAGGVRDFNQYFFDQYYWRDTNRIAPHNVYTSSKLLATPFSDSYGKNAKRPLVPWQYADSSDRGKVSTVIIPYPGSYRVSWKYDAVNNEYVRWLNGKKFLTSTGAEVRTKNILVQSTIVSVIDEVGRRRITTVGTGKSTVFRDGEVVTGTWKKTNLTGRTKFFDENGKEVVLTPGTSWIEVVPNELKVMY